MKLLFWVLGIIVIAVAGFYAFNSYIYQEKQAKMLSYENATYGYAVKYPDTLQVKEYTPEITTIGIIQGDSVNGVADVRVMTIPGTAGESFADAIAGQLENLCAADGPTGSFSCTAVESSEPFAADSGATGTLIYLHGEYKNFKEGTTTAVRKGPYYVFQLGTGATASKVLAIHAPLNKSADEADAATIGAIAKSLKLMPVQESGRYMDIESYVRTSISELSPVKEQLGGKFYVTSIETHGGAGTVSYEDGHNAYTADFTYAVDENGKPSVTGFTIRGQ